MDATEIRSEFLASETLVERIRKFRDDRLALFASNRFPVEGLGGPFTAIHLVPYSAFDPEGLIDLPDLTTELPPLRAGPSGGHYNFDGFLTSASADGGKHLGYVQMFRNGCLEIVDWSMFGRDRERRIPGVAYEREVVRGLSGYRNCLIRRGVTFPVAVMITLAGLEGWTMGVGQAAFPQDVTIDRPILVLPEALLEDDSDLPSILKPVFDTVWNATGWQSSHNYDTDGHWVGD